MDQPKRSTSICLSLVAVSIAAAAIAAVAILAVAIVAVAVVAAAVLVAAVRKKPVCVAYNLFFHCFPPSLLLHPCALFP